MKYRHFGLSAMLVAVALGCIFSVPVCASPKQLKKHVAEALRTISQEKNTAEQWAGILKENWKPESPEFKEGQALYVDANAAFNAWLDQLKYCVDAKLNLEKSPKYQEAVKRAVEKSHLFTNYVRNIYLPEQKTAALKSVPMFGIQAIPISSIVEAGVTIWKEFKAAKKERKEALKASLESLKWKIFKDI